MALKLCVTLRVRSPRGVPGRRLNYDKISTGTAIVTGASRGIGSAIATRRARDGFAIVVNDAGSEAEASAVVKKINANEGRAISAQADVSKPVEAARMFDAAEKEFGDVDVLVNTD
jgi:3-oxoacyl-[acyl-carrier protein] reductase